MKEKGNLKRAQEGTHARLDSNRKKEGKNERNKVEKEREKEIKKRGNHKEAQEGTHARVDSKRKKKRENDRSKINKQKERKT